MLIQPDKFSTDLCHFFINGAAGVLEALSTYPKETPSGVVIICHPHPQQEGTMHNKVVTTLTRAFEKIGLATVRFNYRGVGKSDGEFAHTIGETDDLKSVMQWVQQTLPGLDIWLAGFSFGSYISANVANQADIKQLINIAPVVSHNDYSGFTDIQCPWLMIQGEQDEVADCTDTQAFAANPPAPLKFISIPDVGHFFHGHLIELRELLIQELS